MRAFITVFENLDNAIAVLRITVVREKESFFVPDNETCVPSQLMRLEPLHAMSTPRHRNGEWQNANEGR